MSSKTETPRALPAPTSPSDLPLQGEVVPIDNRPAYERVQDACFEGLLHDYTVLRDWDTVTMVALLWDKVKADRATQNQTIVQNDSDTKDLT